MASPNARQRHDEFAPSGLLDVHVLRVAVKLAGCVPGLDDHDVRAFGGGDLLVNGGAKRVGHHFAVQVDAHGGDGRGIVLNAGGNPKGRVHILAVLRCVRIDGRCADIPSRFTASVIEGLEIRAAFVTVTGGVPGHYCERMRAGGCGRSLANDLILALVHDEVGDKGAAGISAHASDPGCSLEPDGHGQVLGNHFSGGGRADAHADGGSGAIGQIAGDAEVFAGLVDAAKVICGLDDEVVRTVGDAALKEIDGRPAVLKGEFAVDKNFEVADAAGRRRGGGFNVWDLINGDAGTGLAEPDAGG